MIYGSSDTSHKTKTNVYGTVQYFPDPLSKNIFLDVINTSNNTVCPRSIVHSHTVRCYIKIDNTSWTCSRGLAQVFNPTFSCNIFKDNAVYRTNSKPILFIKYRREISVRIRTWVGKNPDKKPYQPGGFCLLGFLVFIWLFSIFFDFLILNFFFIL